MSRGRRAALGLAAAIGLAAGALSGCAGAGRVELVSLNFRSIDPPAPRVGFLNLDRCYWWTDDSGQVWVTLERVRRPLIGPLGQFSFRMSLVLERPPAGKARNYTVAQRELRAVARLGPVESRFVSTAGIVALYREPGDRLRGTFRLQVRRQISRLLGGWGKPSSYLMHGVFTAVHDEQRGRLIAAATESRGWQRDAPQPQVSQGPEGLAIQLDTEQSQRP